MNSWVLILYSLPTRQNAGRVKLWRKLRKFGALAFKTSAYVLPDEPIHFERFQWLAEQIRADGGEATLIRVSQIEGLPHEKIVQLFNDARARDYVEFISALSELVRKNKKKLGTEFHAELEKFQSQFHELREMDYFNCPKAEDAQILLRQAEGLSNRSKVEAPRVDKKRFSRRKWLTRPRPEIDRVASAWLIRHFIDKEAQFIFAPKPQDHPGAVPYDMFEVEFTHHGEDCTFETLVKRFGIEDKSVQAIAEMVHDADLEDGKFKRTECVGIDRVLKGFAVLKLSDAQILTKGFELFDALYAMLTI